MTNSDKRDEIRNEVLKDMKALTEKYEFSGFSMQCILSEALRIIYFTNPSTGCLHGTEIENLFTVALKDAFDPQCIYSQQSLYYLERMKNSIDLIKASLELTELEQYFQGMII